MIVGVLAISAPTEQSPDASAIAKKACAAIMGAKSYESVWEATSSIGQMGSFVFTFEIKMIPSAGKAIWKISPKTNGSRATSRGFPGAESTTVADGKKLSMYLPSGSGYYVSPNKPEDCNPIANLLRMAVRKSTTFEPLSTDTIDGQPCYVLTFDAKMHVEVEKTGTTVQSTVFVDKASNRIKLVKTITTIPGRVIGRVVAEGEHYEDEDSPPLQIITTLVVKSEAFNRKIPSSAFVLTVPPGSKLLKHKPTDMVAYLLGGLGTK